VRPNTDCSAARHDSHWCDNGFPQNGACFVPGGIPICCREAICERLWGWNGGKPDLSKLAEIRSQEQELAKTLQPDGILP
jgi:hypothetical protein